MKKKILEIIDYELEIWKKAYPKQKDLLENFAMKIKLEIELKNENL